MNSTLTRPRLRLIFLHGGPGMDSSYVKSFADSLGHVGEVVIYDHGSTKKASTIEDLLTELESVIESCDARVVLIGHSFGGTLACKYLERLTASNLKVSGIVTICSPLDSSWTESLYSQPSNYEELKHVEMKISALDKCLPPNDLFRAETLCWLPFYFSKDFHLLGRKLLESIQYNFDLFEALSRSFMNDFDVSDSLLKAKVPIFSIWSTSDRIISFEYSDKTSRKFPHIPFSYVDDAGHFPFVEKPNEVKHLIELFVSKIQKEEN